jgi:hypothetical protein
MWLEWMSLRGMEKGRPFHLVHRGFKARHGHGDAMSVLTEHRPWMKYIQENEILTSPFHIKILIFQLIVIIPSKVNVSQ